MQKKNIYFTVLTHPHLDCNEKIKAGLMNKARAYKPCIIRTA